MINKYTFYMLMIAFFAITGCSREQTSQVLVLNGHTMGTSYSVSIADAVDDHQLSSLGEAIQARLQALNDRFSTYKPDSEISRFNQTLTTDWFPVSSELAMVVNAAQQISDISEGAFDITVAPLVNLWGFGPTPQATMIPNAAEIQAQRAMVGYHLLDVQREPPALHKQIPQLTIDLSAIAKGYAVDCIAELVSDAGIQHYLIEIGGELRAQGERAPNKPWRIAIERPDSTHRSIFKVVPLHNSAMATSGDYRNFFEVAGTRYSHTINPKTGAPVSHHLASVTVFDTTTMRADGYATALLVLGPQAGLALARKQQLAAILIERTETGEHVYTSPAAQAMLAVSVESAP
jgi:thiamine biosynthesis lipoprotein